MPLKTLFASLCLVSLFASCGPSRSAIPENAPKWVTNPDMNRAGYLTGVGSALATGDSAGDYARAEENAVNEILSQIVVKVKSIYEKRVKSTTVNGVFNQRVDTLSNVTLSTAGEIPALRKATKWLDEGNKRYYIRLQVSQAELARALSENINGISTKFQGILNRGQAAAKSGQWLGAIAPIQEYLQELPYALMIESQIIGLGYKRPERFDGIINQFTDLQNSIANNASFAVEVAAPALRETAIKFKADSLLSELGFKKSTSPKWRLVVNGDLSKRSESSGRGALLRVAFEGSISIRGAGLNETIPLRDENGNVPEEVAFKSSGRSDPDLRIAAVNAMMIELERLLKKRLSFR